MDINDVKSKEHSEPWPFLRPDPEHRNERPPVELPAPKIIGAKSTPPPLIPTKVSSLPVLVPTKGGQELRTAPLTDDRPKVGTNLPPLVENVSKALKTDPTNPPPLTPTKNGVVEPPPLVETKRVELPPLKVKVLQPTVYLLLGKNHLTEEISICQVISQEEFRKVENKGVSYVADFIRNSIQDNYAKYLEHPEGAEINEHRDHCDFKFEHGQLSPKQIEAGLILKAELIDEFYRQQDIQAQREAADTDEDEDRDYTSDITPELVYSWAFVRCNLERVGYLNLSAILSL